MPTCTRSSLLFMVTAVVLGLSWHAAAWSGDISLHDADSSFQADGDYAGYSLDLVGDVNGDGYEDILIGAYMDHDGPDGAVWSPYAGRTYLVLGPVDEAGRGMDLDESDTSFYGEASNDRSGFSVAGVGDVNGDGYDDFVIGAYGNSEVAAGAGQVYLFLGRDSGWATDVILDDADASFLGEVTGDSAGYSVAGAGDVNGDGYDDFVIGASGNDEGGTSAGQVYLILGSPIGWTMDTSLAGADASYHGIAGDWVGYDISGVGDVNGDGFSDLLFGASGNDEANSLAGKVYVVFGKASGWSLDTSLASADASFLGENDMDYAGFSLGPAGDVNGDGFDDMLVAAPGNGENGPNAGQVYLIFGMSQGWAQDASLANVDASFLGVEDDSAAQGLATAGDVDGDGFDDLLIGVSNHGGGYGVTYLFLGRATGWTLDTPLGSADVSCQGFGWDSGQSGRSVAGGRDMDGDGLDDFIIGAPFGHSAYLFLDDIVPTSLADANPTRTGSMKPIGITSEFATSGSVNTHTRPPAPLVSALRASS